jgi:hypothetical protein
LTLDVETSTENDIVNDISTSENDIIINEMPRSENDFKVEPICTPVESPAQAKDEELKFTAMDIIHSKKFRE